MILSVRLCDFLPAIQDPGCSIEKVASWLIENCDFAKWAQQRSKGVRELRIFAKKKSKIGM